MKQIRFMLVLAFALSVVAPAVWAQESGASQSDQVAMDALKHAIRSNRKALVAVNLGLSKDEAAKFWVVVACVVIVGHPCLLPRNATYIEFGLSLS